MPHSAVDLVSVAGWSYVFIAALVAADAVLPALPGEAVVIAAGLLASSGDLQLGLVALAACAGSFAGDNTSFALGRTAGGWAAARFIRGGRGQELLEWARAQLEIRGRVMILAARFIPGGRTATTFTAGTVGMPWRRFAAVDAVAAVVWSIYTTALGYVGGATFHDNPWAALAASLGAAAVVALAAEVVHRRRA